MKSPILLGVAGLSGAVIILGQMNVGATPGQGVSDRQASVGNASGTIAEPDGGSPDVIVGSLPSTVHWATNGTESSYSIATTSCNIGDANLDWIDTPSNKHPVIGQNMFRLKDGRFEQIGQSWLKHAFCALQQTLSGCGDCNGGGGCLSYLSPGCADPYSASRHGSQAGLGPKHIVNAHTGFFPINSSFPYWPQGEGTSGSYRRRIRVQNVDLANPGALYFIEGQYVALDDAAARRNNNNASYRQVNVNSSNFDLTFAGGTQMMKAGIEAWKDNDPTVTLVTAIVPFEGKFVIGYKVTDNGNGTWDYEYAVYNMNSDRSGAKFIVPADNSVTVTNMGFHDVAYHSGDGIDEVNYDDTDWAAVRNSADMTWSTESHATNPNANALRWGTLYNYRFRADSGPVEVEASIDLFKPGTPDNVVFTVMGPETKGPSCSRPGARARVAPPISTATAASASRT